MTDELHADHLGRTVAQEVMQSDGPFGRALQLYCPLSGIHICCTTKGSGTKSCLWQLIPVDAEHHGHSRRDSKRGG